MLLEVSDTSHFLFSLNRLDYHVAAVPRPSSLALAVYDRAKQGFPMPACATEGYSSHILGFPYPLGFYLPSGF